MPTLLVAVDVSSAREGCHLLACSFVALVQTYSIALVLLAMMRNQDTAAAGMLINGKAGVQGVKYSLGSTWIRAPGGQDTFEVTPSGITVTGTPPLSPSAATVFFYGTEKYGLKAKLLNDAPEI